MVQAADLGFSRACLRSELRKATEAYWKGEIDYAARRKAGGELRARHWMLQGEAGIDVIPSNDFSFYDHVLDMTAMVGAVPPRFRKARVKNGIAVACVHRTASAYAMMADVAESSADQAALVDFETYFAMARGTDAAPAMEIATWFDTTYQYIVPEFQVDQEFHLASRKAIDEFNEAKALGIHTRPMLIGPVTYLSLGKVEGGGFDPIELLDKLLPVYVQVLAQLDDAGADWVQLDEPVLALHLTEAQRNAFKLAYGTLSTIGVKILLATYPGKLGDNLNAVADLPIDGLRIDLVCAPDELDLALTRWPTDRMLSLGGIDGRNIWRGSLG